MQKIQVTLDAKKLRNLVSKRTYKNREGQEVIVQEVNFDLVEMKEESKKTVYSAHKYELVKTHFAVARQTKEEREANAESVFIGEGISLIWKNEKKDEGEVHDAQVVDNSDEDDLPF